MPTFTHGKSTVFKIDDSGGTLRDISDTLTDVSFPRSVDTAETSSFGDSAKTYIVGLSDATISVSGNFDATVDGYLSGVIGLATPLEFEYGPEGSTAPDVKYTGTCFLTSYEKSGAIGDVVTYSAEFQVTGAVTRGAYA